MYLREGNLNLNRLKIILKKVCITRVYFNFFFNFILFFIFYFLFFIFYFLFLKKNIAVEVC